MVTKQQLLKHQTKLLVAFKCFFKCLMQIVRTVYLFLEGF